MVFFCFCSITGKSPRVLPSGKPGAVQLAWTPENTGDREHQFRGQTFHAKAVKETTVRGCPICLRQDSESADGPPAESMALRGHWMLRPATICLHHRHPLVPL
ncbi:TniQ family protein [Rhodobacter capsulatus]|uniref:TniQ family protein n=1 Tax=Rhodobacter capsulatus TaxID=1061 RepID=UPI0020165985|nr:TniQ family protein [Rhodobacter capsulatus]